MRYPRPEKQIWCVFTYMWRWEKGMAGEEREKTAWL